MEVLAVIQLIRAAVGAGIDLVGVFRDLADRIEARGGAFDWSDVDYFKQQYNLADQELDEAIAKARAEDEGVS